MSDQYRKLMSYLCRGCSVESISIHGYEWLMTCQGSRSQEEPFKDGKAYLLCQVPTNIPTPPLLAIPYIKNDPQSEGIKRRADGLSDIEISRIRLLREAWNTITRKPPIRLKRVGNHSGMNSLLSEKRSEFRGLDGIRWYIETYEIIV